MNNKKDFFEKLKESHEDEKAKWPPPWIVSFSDMMALLLTFFIFFYSVTALKELPKILEHFKKKSDIIVPIESDEFPVPPKTTLIKREYTKRESDVIEEFRKYLKAAGFEKDIKLKASAKEFKITIANPILFDLGKADLKPEAIPIFKKLSGLFKTNDDYIRVEGHTDNLPIHTEKFPSNWELSAARAITVIRFFIDKSNVSPMRFEALGYGEFHPAAKNDTKEGRAKNRRVEIKIIKKRK
jgi:chemotaxis protein MotB